MSEGGRQGGANNDGGGDGASGESGSRQPPANPVGRERPMAPATRGNRIKKAILKDILSALSGNPPPAAASSR